MGRTAPRRRRTSPRWRPARERVSWSHRARTASLSAVADAGRRRTNPDPRGERWDEPVASTSASRRVSSTDDAGSGLPWRCCGGRDTWCSGAEAGRVLVRMRARKPLRQPANQKAWRGKTQTMMILGPREPAEISARAVTRETARARWRTIRVRKKVDAKRTSERRRGRRLPMARMKVGT